MKKLIGLFAIVFATSASAQQLGLNTTFDSQCQCNVVTNHNDDGTVSSVHRESLNGKKHGVETVYYPNGAIQYSRTWANGLLNGTGSHYRADGSTYYQEHYVNGVKTGTWNFYDEQGELMQSIAYNGNNSDGVYNYHHGGVLYFSQVVTNGSVASEQVHNQTIYDALVAEAQAAQQAGKP